MSDERNYYNIDDLESLGVERQGVKIPLGVAPDGVVAYFDFKENPHLLVAGNSGAGKSQLIHTMIRSLVLQNSSEALNLILIDPKKMGLKYYENQKIPHILLPVVMGHGWYGAILKWNVLEIKSRIELFMEKNIKNIDEYNTQEADFPLPRIIIFIDEYAQVLEDSPSEIERYLTRIAKFGGTFGIHLVLATTHPLEAVYSREIKDQINARISLKVNSEKDSILIINQPGAENLLGTGDMLFKSVKAAKASRLQGFSITDDQISGLHELVKEDS